MCVCVCVVFFAVQEVLKREKRMNFVVRRISRFLLRLRLVQLVDRAVEFAIHAKEPNEAATIALAIDRLAVNLGAAIAMIVPGYISTEVDPRLSFDTEASVARGRRIIELYKEMGVPKERVLIKLAATWEGIKAAEILEREGIQCNLTLIFSFVQAVACAQYGAHLISPFPGRILDWNKVKLGRTQGVPPEEDEGVVAVRKMYNYFKVSVTSPGIWFFLVGRFRAWHGE